jgi:murein DD-endopeptidase MepM/ murein hydrolase activator NlpD
MRHAFLRRAVVVLVALVLTACGQMITRPAPTTLPPTPTPTPVLMPTLPPTATPVPYTPEPTATPTPTPTPIIHTIARGETLIAIAARYGVSVAAVQELNGIADPRRLQVGQQIFIPPPPAAAPGGESSPTPVSTPLPVDIGPVYFGYSLNGGLWLLGEVRNPGSQPLEGVRLRARLQGEGGHGVAEDETMAAGDVLLPGEASPFGVYFARPPQRFSGYVLETQSAFPAHSGRYYLDLVATDVTWEGERYALYQVKGRIRNKGPETAVEVRLVVTLYDALGQVVGFVVAEPEHNRIAPGGETPFQVAAIPLGGPVTQVRVTAWGRRLPTPTSTP